MLREESSIVDIDLAFLEVRQIIALGGQWPLCGAIQALTPCPTSLAEFFKGPLVQVFKACTNGIVSLSQTEEALMARPRQNPSLNNLYADFSLGFILGFSWTGGQHRCRVMTHKVLCGTPQRGFVAIWLCNERRIVWSNEGGHTSDKFHRIASRADSIRLWVRPEGRHCKVRSSVSSSSPCTLAQPSSDAHARAAYRQNRTHTDPKRPTDWAMRSPTGPL